MSRLLEIAERVAREAHLTQTEIDGAPYICHVERVVSLVEGEVEKAIAWLHDVLEDSAFTPTELVICAGVPQDIVVSVLVLTRRKAEEDYASYIQRVKDSGDAEAISVKLADLRDHLRPNCPTRLRPRYERAWIELTGHPFV